MRGLGLFLFITICVSTALADSRELKTGASEKIDAVLVLDASGSMLLTDPQNLRHQGAKIFVQSLKTGDRLGIVSFSDKAEVIRPLSNFESTQSSAIGAEVEKAAATGTHTDLLSGIQAAYELLAHTKRGDASPVIILLSDGKMEPSGDAQNAQRATSKLLEELLPQIGGEGIKIHTLAFSELADKDLLSQIAARTEGINWFTPTSDKVHESFTELFLAVKKPQVVALKGKGFTIDKDIDEATFYINREGAGDVKVQSPAGAIFLPGSVHPSIKWFQGTKFDIVTIIKPEVGDWKVLGIPSNDGFATVLTRLKLVSDWPSQFEAEEPVLLQARLFEAEKPIVLPDMAGAIRFAVQISATDKITEPLIRELLVDDGTHGDKIAKDGIFSLEMRVAEPGEYRVQLVAQAPTFERRQQLPFRVRPPQVTLTVVGEGAAPIAHGSKAHDDHASSHGEHAAPDAHHKVAGHEDHHGDDHNSGHEAPAVGGGEYFQITLSEDALKILKPEVRLSAVSSARKKFTIIAKEVGEGTYQVPTGVLKEGTYTVQATVQGDSKNKKAVKLTSRPMTFKQEGVVDEHVLVVEEQHAPVHSTDSFPIGSVLFLTLLNVGGAFGVIKLLQRSQGQASAVLPAYTVPADLEELLGDLRARSQESHFSLDDPMFKSPPARRATPAQAEASSEDTNETSREDSTDEGGD